jgi:hypothetical protein
MSSIFLCHTSVNKSFVEKLANDLTRIGVKVWFDKWEIKAGESLTWKIEEGIRANEYFGIVLSPEALVSEWVRHELSAAWIKQMNLKKIVVLPILFQVCDVPLFLQDRKYVNFTQDYNSGLKELAHVFGIKNTDLISLSNWRKFKNNKSINWRTFREQEFSLLVTKLVDYSLEYNWSSWVGGTKMPYSICVNAFINKNKKKSVSIRLDGNTNAYLATLKEDWNPNHFQASDFKTYVGNTINEVEEFVWRLMEDFKVKYGNPIEKGTQTTGRFLSNDEKNQAIKGFMQTMNWYRGDKLITPS